MCLESSPSFCMSDCQLDCMSLAICSVKPRALKLGSTETSIAKLDYSEKMTRACLFIIKMEILPILEVMIT